MYFGQVGGVFVYGVGQGEVEYYFVQVVVQVGGVLFQVQLYLWLVICFVNFLEYLWGIGCFEGDVFYIDFLQCELWLVCLVVGLVVGGDVCYEVFLLNEVLVLGGCLV